MEVDPSTRISQAQSAAARAEREAAERVTKAHQTVREATHEEQKQLDHVRDEYEKRGEVERARGDDYIEAVRNRSYQSVADVRRKADAETNRVSRKAEKELKDLDQHYSSANYKATQRGETNLKDTSTRAYQQQQYARAQGEDQLEAIKNNYAIQQRSIEADRSNTTESLTKASQESRKKLETKTREAVEQSTEHYNSAYEGAMKNNREALGDLNWRATKDVEALKRDTAIKLDAYHSQKSDPFYRMVNIDGILTENEDQFVFTAKIPEHERDRINVTIRGNDLVISGKRKSEEVLEVSPGRTQRTSAYQSFSESFPLNWPVNPKNMTREFEGDTLLVRIPKKASNEPAKVKRIPEKAVAERPTFPKNLPTEKQLVELNDAKRGPDPSVEKIPPSKRKNAGSTIA